MIIDSFHVDAGCEHTWCNVYIEPLHIDGKVMYLVGTTAPGEGIPPKEQLYRFAEMAETVSVFNNGLTLEALCILIKDAVQSGTWGTPFLISEKLIDIPAPCSPYEEGLADAVRGLHYNANPYKDGTEFADQWDEGWAEGRAGNFVGLRH